VYEKHDQIASGISLSSRTVHVLARTMSLFNSSKLWLVCEHFPDFILVNVVPSFQFLHNVLKPDKARDFHQKLLI
jgi:hypothetical protein